MLRLALFFACLGLVVRAAHGATDAEIPLTAFGRVTVAPTKTSIYVGRVSMTMPPFVRSGSVFETSYVAKVFPYFFYNEEGRLSVEISDEALRRLERGEPIDFKGRAVRDDGAERRVEGRATPVDAARGKIKVRVFYSRRIELNFNTTYHFPDVRPTPTQAGSPP
jgi:hypothetical protein